MVAFIIVAAAAVGSIMLWALVLPFKPTGLSVAARFVCRGTEKFEVVTSVASYHRPGERSISVYCNDFGRQRDVKGKTFLIAFLMAFAALLPVAIIVSMIFSLYFKGEI